jgi:rhodanese-related sulfurtransferase
LSKSGAGLHLLDAGVVFYGVNTPSAQTCTTHVLQRAQTGALLVDVRERTEAQALAFDTPAIINIPMSALEQRWQELPKDRELLVVCQSGEKSPQASQFLQAQGFTNVKPLRGGIVLWMQKGYPVIGRRFTATDEAVEQLPKQLQK